MKKDLLYSLWLLMSVLILSSFTDGPDNATKGKINGHEYVDLGLPSGVKWATCNVGASKPEEYGGYYAWGETKEKSNYDWSTYKWCQGSYSTMTKYSMDSYFGTKDYKTALDSQDDVAHVKWGGSWRTPSLAEHNELLKNCTWTWTTQNGVQGYIVTGPNGNSIFLPAAGRRFGTDLYDSGGYYWSSSLEGRNCRVSCRLIFDSSDCGWDPYYGDRYCGHSVRPVSGGNSSNLPSKVDSHEYVDLGLPSGIKWATCNVGAFKPEEYGGYYAWGETEEKSNYEWSTYKWCKGSDSTMTKYCISGNYGIVDNKTILDPEDDVAHVKWGGSWRMPTEAEQDELFTNCIWEWTALNGVKGYRATGPNGNSIFLPAAGNISGTTRHNNGSDLWFWSSSCYNCLADALSYANDGCGNHPGDRCHGLSVRPVSGGNSSQQANCKNEPTEPVRKVSSAPKNTGRPLLDLAGREAIGGLVKPVYDSFDEGTIVVNITVSCQGEVVRAEINSYRTICASLRLRNAALAAARQTKFNKVEGIEEQKGSITYDFRLLTKISSKKNGKINGHEYVDLGLPSGLKWATCNVGASSPEEYGGYYAWGETEEKSNYDYGTYKWHDGSNDSKYCADSSNGVVDNKTTLDPQDDVAHVKWGGSWRMPTLEEQEELLNNCSWECITQNGVKGFLVTGPNGNSIFLPAAGCRYGTELRDSGSEGDYWLNLWEEDENGYGSCAYMLYFDYNGYGRISLDMDRDCGRSVRPVSDGESINQPGKVKEMAQQAKQNVPQKRIVLFEISPVDSKAQVTYSAEGSSDYIVFGNGVIDESGMVADRLEPGVYHYRITSKDYCTVEGRIVLDDAPQKHTEKITLRSKYGTLTLQATDNAEILIDGEKVGTGSWSGALSPGNYKVECRLVAHKSTVKTIKVSEGDNLTVRLDHPTPITGTLSLMSSPLGAIVSIDGKKCGKTPDYFSGLLIGTHTITVSKNGYKTVVMDVEIREDEVLEKNVVLDEGNDVIKMTGTFEENKSKLPVPITGSYQGNVMINNGGLTFKGVKGAQARAVFDGVVSTVFYHNDYICVLVRHENYRSVYCNLKNVRVKSGDAVKAGDIIADVTPDAEDGNPTLLFQLYKEKTLLDPTDWLRL